MQKAIFIIGLPGSGKTTYLQDHAEEFSNALVCDDFYKSATIRPRHSLEFEGSAYYEDVKTALVEGKDVVIADILFCDSSRLKEAEEGLKRLAVSLGIEVVIEQRFFEGDSAACVENIKRRNRPERVEKELAFIEEMGEQYRPPNGAAILPIYRPK